MLRTRKGFTLIELMLVVFIIGIILAIAVPSVMTFMEAGDNTENVKVMTQEEEAELKAIPPSIRAPEEKSTDKGTDKKL